MQYHELKANVFNIQHYSLHDGPGIRTIIFLKGCPMRCKWCCNPESQRYEKEISFRKNKCIGESACKLCRNICETQAISFAEEQVHIDYSKCSGCLKCSQICPSKAIKIEGEDYSITQLLDIIEKDAVFYNHGEGGVTISGGEPLTHPEVVIALLKGAHQRRITTAIETCGYADYNNLYEIAIHLDTIFYDIKSLDEEKHILYTGCSNKRILDNFKKLCNDYPNLPVNVRTPVIPGFNDEEEELQNIKDFIKCFPNVSHELLPYHTLGKSKYESLGRKYPMEEEFVCTDRKDDKQ